MVETYRDREVSVCVVVVNDYLQVWEGRSELCSLRLSSHMGVAVHSHEVLCRCFSFFVVRAVAVFFSPGPAASDELGLCARGDRAHCAPGRPGREMGTRRTAARSTLPAAYCAVEQRGQMSARCTLTERVRCVVAGTTTSSLSVAEDSPGYIFW